MEASSSKNRKGTRSSRSRGGGGGGGGGAGGGSGGKAMNVYPPLRIGQYEVSGRLGSGGMAETFRAIARGPGGYTREVVIKCILPHLTEDERYVRMFIAEARILGMLNHPNIVHVYDFGEDESRHFLALEYIDGPSLSQIQEEIGRSGQSVPPAVAAYIGREICLALAAVHELRGPDGDLLNVVHRDVTPSNIMVTLAGGVKLLDFGVAHLGSPGSATRSRSIKGKPAYFAPEQIVSADIDGRVDLFALGVVLHELLSGQPLFWSDNDLGIVYKIMEAPQVPPSSVKPGISPELDAVVMRALQRNPALRFQTAAEMAGALDAVVVAAGLRREEVSEFVSRFEGARGGAATPRDTTMNFKGAGLDNKTRGKQP